MIVHTAAPIDLARDAALQPKSFLFLLVHLELAIRSHGLLAVL
jgi:hypothetical protein